MSDKKRVQFQTFNVVVPDKATNTLTFKLEPDSKWKRLNGVYINPKSPDVPEKIGITTKSDIDVISPISSKMWLSGSGTVNPYADNSLFIPIGEDIEREYKLRVELGAYELTEDRPIEVVFWVE